MQVILDQDSWEVAGDTPLSAVLEDLVDKAKARHRIVTHLTVGGQPVTDRELQPALLMKTIMAAGTVQASTRTVPEAISGARQSAARYAETLRAEAAVLSDRLRAGEPAIAELDRWLGGLADYVEYLVHADGGSEASVSPEGLTSCIHELLAARDRGDIVRLTDLLEYELAPRLAL